MSPTISSSATRSLVAVASSIIIVAGMRAASSIIVPFLLATFVAFICLPPVSWMQSKRVPKGLAVLITLIAIMAVLSLVGTLVGSSVNSFIGSLPNYEARLAGKTASLLAWLDARGMDVSAEQLSRVFNPGTAMRMVGNTLASLSGALTNAFLILITVAFILFEAADFPLKLRSAVSDPESAMKQAGSIRETLYRYLALKTLFSLLTGLLVFAWLAFLGVDYALLWGLIAFLLNYVPSIGSILAAIPAVLLASIQFGLGKALMVVLGYLVINVLIGNLTEPRVMGRGLGLSTLIVFLSLVFWGWVLGPVGMLLSVPLTMVIKIVMGAQDDTRWLAIMLGPRPPRDEQKA